MLSINVINTKTIHPITANLITIGRSSSCTVRIPLPDVSRVHAELCVVDGIATLTDNASLNGTYVNGNRLGQCVPHPLKDGDTITICGIPIYVKELQPY